MAGQLNLQSNFPFPAWRHQPGRTQSADHRPLEALKILVPAQFESFVPLGHSAFQYGLALHDNGYFWEAHEVWEAVWLAAPKNGRDRIALRALIQIANAGLKAVLNKDTARNRLVVEAQELLNELAMRMRTETSDSVANRLLDDELIVSLTKWQQQNASAQNNKRFSTQCIRLTDFFTSVGSNSSMQNNSC